VFQAFAPEKDMLLYNRGIRRRLATMLGGDPRRLEMAHSLLFTLPGTPIMRYGDEIGMGDDLSLPERESVRTPMQWTADYNGGFSTSKKTVLPVIMEGPFGTHRVNVAEQRRDPGSLLNAVERMVRMRKECPELGWGDYRVLASRSPQVMAVLATWRNNSVLSLHNFDDQAQEVRLAAPGAEKQPLTNLLSPDHSMPDEQGRHSIALPPYGYRWYRIGPLLDVMKRESR
jgi:maltose alpha-D-glucosyltransferase/alpha-amylase